VLKEMSMGHKNTNPARAQKSAKQVRYPVYLIVADGTDEFDYALRYGARSAVMSKARLAVLYVMPSDNLFLPWKQVNDRIEADRRLQAEDFMRGVGARLAEYGLTPSLYIRSGRSIDSVKDLVNSDHASTQLILAGNTQGRDPGLLVSYFTGRGLSEINVPVTIVPNHLDDETFEHFFEQID